MDILSRLDFRNDAVDAGEIGKWQLQYRGFGAEFRVSRFLLSIGDRCGKLC